MNSRRDRGQALVEFAIVIPVFLVLLFGIVDFGRVIWATSSLSNAASEGARFAIVHGGSETTPCPVGPTTRPDLPSPNPCPFDISPSKKAIRDVALNAAIAVSPLASPTVCYGVGCTGDVDATTGGTNARGTPVTVTVSGTVSLFTPSLLGIKSIPVSGSSTMMVNH